MYAPAAVVVAVDVANVIAVPPIAAIVGFVVRPVITNSYAILTMFYASLTAGPGPRTAERNYCTVTRVVCKCRVVTIDNARDVRTVRANGARACVKRKGSSAS